MTDTAYDYIIVGAGSSGCVLANRLSADPSVRVLVVEAGPPDTSPFIPMPRGIGKILIPGNPLVWDYDVSTGGNRRNETWLKGRTLGGSSSVNGMVYVRGAPADYDGWAALGCAGWGWDEIGKCFVELEDHQLGAKEWRGAGGPLKVSVHPAGNPLLKAVIDAAVQAGTPFAEDTNDIPSVTNGGIGYQPQTTWQGRRFSAARAFLRQAEQRPNVTVMTDTQVLKIEFTGRRATGVRLRGKDGERSVAVRGEVILSAGAIESPKLLQLSGIGAGALLQGFGIPVVADSPNVGENLREHRYLSMQFRVTGHSLNNRFSGLGLLGSVFDYYVRSKGPMTHAAHEAGGFVKTRPGLDRPDAQIGINLYTMTAKGKQIVLEDQPGLGIGGYFMRPESQGVVRIQSPDPAARPYIDANHFAAEIDRVSTVSLFHWMRKCASQPALKPFILAETMPGKDIHRDEDILNAFLEMGSTAFHICGTARMGVDAGAVLDPQLRVRGVDGVRVVDTSIMPTIVSGNTNAPAMAIALRASKMILSEAQQPASAA